MEHIINNLLKFSDSILELGEPICDDRVEKFESLNNVLLPDDFKKFIKKINGFSLMGTVVLGFNSSISESIESVYYYEHYEINFPQFVHLVPFSNDGQGNFYCLDTLNILENGDCPVVFWVSNYEFSEKDMPEVTHDNFLDWIQEVVIDWTLEDFDYNGFELH